MADGITAIVTLTLRPETMTSFPAVLEERLEITRVSDGFRNIRVLIHPEDPGRVMMIEHWESEAVFRAYSEWRTTTDPIDAARYYASPPQVSVWADLLDIDPKPQDGTGFRANISR